MLSQLPSVINQQPDNWLIQPEQHTGGRALVVFFWSISCTMCKEKMPGFLHFAKEESLFYDMLFVHVPRSAADLAVHEIKEYMQQLDVPVYLDHKHQMKNTFRVQKLPSIALIDKNGRLRHLQAGGNFTTMLTKQLDSLKYS
jgi:thiol-disulfide isomerase/thioredoxin